MSTKEKFPPNNSPPEKSTTTTYLKCKYCDYTCSSPEQFRVHISKYHEAVVAEEGQRAREKGGNQTERQNDFLAAHGYIRCRYWSVPCAGPENPLMRRVCQHLLDCPVQMSRTRELEKDEVGA